MASGPRHQRPGTRASHACVPAGAPAVQQGEHRQHLLCRGDGRLARACAVQRIKRGSCVTHAGDGGRSSPLKTSASTASRLGPPTRRGSAPARQRDRFGRERAALEARQPHGRLVTADEIAAAIGYLAGPQAGSTTGTTLVIDGRADELAASRPAADSTRSAIGSRCRGTIDRASEPSCPWSASTSGRRARRTSFGPEPCPEIGRIQLALTAKVPTLTTADQLRSMASQISSVSSVFASTPIWAIVRSRNGRAAPG